jgi:hypothetical protein
MYQFFNFDLDKNFFLDLFYTNSKDMSSKVFTKSKVNLLNVKEINEIFEYFKFIPYDLRSIDLVKIENSVGPYINPKNNGLILLPLSGTLDIIFYDYVPTYKNNRPILDPNTKKSEELLKKIEDSYIEAIKVSSPVAFNGLIPHKYTPNREFISIILKIPFNYKWDDVQIKGTNYEIL